MAVDFADLRARVRIEQVVEMLSLQVKGHDQLRGPCSGCGRGGPRALSVTPKVQRFYCFGTRAHGDLIALYCHIAGLDPRDGARQAAEEIARHFGLPSGATTVPQRPEAAAQAATPPGIGNVASYLVYDHDAVKTLGLDEATARALGIGYAPKGMMSGRVAIPIRAQDGSPICYVGYSASKEPPLKLGKVNLPT